MPSYLNWKYVVIQDNETGLFYFNIIETNYTEDGFLTEQEAEVAAKEYIENNLKG